MKRLAPGLIVLSLVACGSDDDGGGGSGGSSSGGSSTGGSSTGGSSTGGTAGSGGTAGTGGSTGGTGGSTGGTGGSTGGTGGSTGGTGGSTGGTGGSTGGTGGSTGGTGGSTGGTGGSTGGTGGSGAAAATADEVGAFFYKKSDGSNTLRWIKSDGTQRVAGGYSLSSNWQTITSVKNLAGAGAEVVFHTHATSGTQHVIADVTFNNDTTSAQKTNNFFGLAHDLATKVEEGRGLWFDNATGHWVAGGWGASAWDTATAKEGTLTAAAYTSMFACNDQKYVYFHEKDTDKLYRREYTAGALGTTVTSITVAKGALATCVDSTKGLIFIYANNGSGWLYQWGATAPTTHLTTWTTFTWDWSHIVRLRNGQTLFYRKTDGIGGTVVFSEASPWSAAKGSYAAGVLPANIDLVTAF